MTILTVRRLAADIMNVGENRVKISPSGLKEAEGALTRVDVRNLIEKGIITKAKVAGRASTKKRTRRGKGRKRGSFGDSKALWMQKIRSQRKFLKLLLDNGALDKNLKRAIYNKLKSGIFRNKKAMLLYLKDNGSIAQDYEPPKQTKPVVKNEMEKSTKTAGKGKKSKSTAPGQEEKHQKSNANEHEAKKVEPQKKEIETKKEGGESK